MHTLFVTTSHTVDECLTLLFSPAVFLLLPSRTEIEWGSRYVYVAVLNEGTHVAEEECEDKRCDMATIDVSIGHDDDLVIAELS